MGESPCLCHPAEPEVLYWGQLTVNSSRRPFDVFKYPRIPPAPRVAYRPRPPPPPSPWAFRRLTHPELPRPEDEAWSRFQLAMWRAGPGPAGRAGDREQPENEDDDARVGLVKAAKEVAVPLRAWVVDSLTALLRFLSTGLLMVKTLYYSLISLISMLASDWLIPGAKKVVWVVFVGFILSLAVTAFVDLQRSLAAERPVMYVLVPEMRAWSVS
jgi:hypothetical protein